MNLLLKEQLLNIMDIQENQKTLDSIQFVASNTNQDISKITKKLSILNPKLEHVKGFISISNSSNKIKIDYKHSISKEIQQEFYQICENWARKYKINTQYNPEKDKFYVA